jgi:small subunit ribosomal protein S16
MTRMGRRHRPFFRINAVESHTPRDGRILEKLGHYDPIEKDKSKQLVLDKERVQYWLDKGAVPSDTVSEILSRNGIKTPVLADRQTRRAKALAISRKKGVPFTKAEKEAAKAASEEAKKAEEAKKKEEKKPS